MTIAVSAFAVWLFFAVLTYRQFMRLSFWKFPTIWQPHDTGDVVPALFVALVGVIAFWVIFVEVGCRLLPPIPSDAWKLASKKEQEPTLEERAMQVLKQRLHEELP